MLLSDQPQAGVRSGDQDSPQNSIFTAFEILGRGGGGKEGKGEKSGVAAKPSGCSAA